ncbi:MAG: response regulator [Candidatus Omnitrophica bacterium]|nr:response regulator [Candidatus Omnitrophota bacterium]
MGIKILVVDDEPDVLITIKNRLVREGFSVITASDGEEALMCMYRDNPDILLLDLMMPKKNGFEVLKEVREKFTDKWRPVIIVTANADLETTKRCYAMEADHYLIKPCSLEEVVKAVRTMIALMKQRIQ